MKDERGKRKEKRGKLRVSERKIRFTLMFHCEQEQLGEANRVQRKYLLALAP